jgi:predicted site-specific integrase-resolvase
MLAGVKLSEWAGISGVSRQSATWWFHAGTILAGAPERAAAGVAVYALVSSSGLRSDLGRRVAWLAG